MKVYSMIAVALLAGGATVMAPAESGASPPRPAHVRVMPGRGAQHRHETARRVHRTRVHRSRNGHVRHRGGGAYVYRHGCVVRHPRR
ncbi:MAG: hypothetical protein U0793_29330 [Gemmataceae bacterium]